MHVLKYIKGTTNLSLLYTYQSIFSLSEFSDVDWGNCLTTHHSSIGYCIFISHALVFWKTKKQATIFRSRVESK